MNIAFGWKVNFANVQNSLADVLGFNRLLEYGQGFYESNLIFNILGVDDINVVNDLV